MRLIQRLGLATLSALAVTAFVGAGSASATVLCAAAPEAGNKCPAGQKYGMGGFKTTAENPVLTNTISNITCKHSELNFLMENLGGPTETVKGKVTEQNFINCKTSIFGISCTVEVNNLPYAAEFHVSASGNGTLKIKNGGSGQPQVKVTCAGGIISCTFGSEPTLNFFGGNPATIEGANVTTNLAGAKCPASGAWDFVYQAIAPSNVWITKE